MSHQLIAHSPDLKRLQDEGYAIAIVKGYLLVRNVPYVSSNCTIKRGILISPLDLSGDMTVKPSSHVAYWTGEHPCHSDGNKIQTIENSSAPQDLAEGVRADFTFSAKADYRDYYHKITTYVDRIYGEATKLDPSVTPNDFLPIPEDSEESVFKYVDTASSRTNIVGINHKLDGLHIGIVGLGGTGAYILDLIAKTYVKEIHLFDGDVFLQHNAFRSPSAPSLEQLWKKPKKVAFHAHHYSNMRNGIIPHDEFLSEANLDLLDGLDFLFMGVEQGEVKRQIVARLIANKTPFVDVGMGVHANDGLLGGNVRAVLSTPENRELAAPYILYGEDGGGNNNEYATNIQIAELNALNATMAVTLWKKHYGVYHDSRGAYYFGYVIASGEMIIHGTNE